MCFRLIWTHKRGNRIVCYIDFRNVVDNYSNLGGYWNAAGLQQKSCSRMVKFAGFARDCAL